MFIFDLRKRIFIGIGIFLGIVIALSLLYAFVFGRKSGGGEKVGKQMTDEASVSLDTSAPATSQGPNAGALIISSPSFTGETNEELSIKQLARLFVERFATYSNQNNNQHIADVLPLVTQKMASWVNTQKTTPGTSYTGVTTKVIASAVTSFASTASTVTVDVQQVTENEGGTQTSYRSGMVNFIQEDGAWKVDGFFWK